MPPPLPSRSPSDPRLQVAWDATSLRALMFCPRYYELTVLKGYHRASVDLEFGRLAHGAFELFLKERLAGSTKANAQREAVRWALENSGRYEDVPNPREGLPRLPPTWVPWGGVWDTVWHCTHDPKVLKWDGTKKCPYAHKGKWFPGEGPEECGTCGSPTENSVMWLPEDKAKNRNSLIRLVVWWTEEQPDDGPDGKLTDAGIAPLAFPDGTPAVELSFQVPLPWKSPHGDQYILCGHLDGLVSAGGQNFIGEHKTTKNGVGKAFFAKFSPDVQIDTYDLAGNLLFPELKLRGVMVSGANTLIGGVEFATGIAHRNDEQREEFLEDLHYWIGRAEGYAEKGHWPMNRGSCWLCPMKGVCSKPPSTRQMHLDNSDEITKGPPWDPLEER